ncbi:pentatricopeptide repeat-containing protein At5g48730, chloroplastic isoform X2 [Brassica napus]|uniref:pentatricopeptide repeat-containing protein At5g48730, chloroplastic isoform X2 n=1 Tax=Brassica napus TaxID=3708 RepID=UPI002078BFFD|nr:pentatricopeptide repeat-containing protein At5g48730, chloroplastic isoform X2 [Brassica napus]
MVSLSTSTSHAHPLPSAYNRRPAERDVTVRCVSFSPREPKHTSNGPSLALRETRQRKWVKSTEEAKERYSKEIQDEMNSKIASRKAISIILRREATKAIIEKKKGPTNSKKLLPRTVLEALHERITALRWESALQVFAFDEVQALLSDMGRQGIRPNTITYNTLIDAYGKAKMFVEMESTLIQMLGEDDCKPDSWTMNSTLRAFGGNGQIEMMENCYEKFQRSGIEPNIRTFNILLDSYGKTGNYKKMSAVMEFMQKYHYSWTIVTYNVVIDAFGRAGDLKQMEYLFRLMQSERIKPSCVTLCSLVRAYGRAGKADKIGGVLRFIENSDVRLDLVFFNCLVDAYGRMEKFAEMKGVLELMEKKGFKPDKITYRTMVKAYRISGMTSHVKELDGVVESVGEAQVVLKKPDF